jgi:hypothetical protein
MTSAITVGARTTHDGSEDDDTDSEAEEEWVERAGRACQLGGADSSLYGSTPASSAQDSEDFAVREMLARGAGSLFDWVLRDVVLVDGRPAPKHIESGHLHRPRGLVRTACSPSAVAMPFGGAHGAVHGAARDAPMVVGAARPPAAGVLRPGSIEAACGGRWFSRLMNEPGVIVGRKPYSVACPPHPRRLLPASVDPRCDQPCAACAHARAVGVMP